MGRRALMPRKKYAKKELDIDIGKIHFSVDERDIADEIEQTVFEAVRFQVRTVLGPKINAVVKKAIKAYATDAEIEKLAKQAVKAQIKESFKQRTNQWP
jgi:hypothetical protein